MHSVDSSLNHLRADVIPASLALPSVTQPASLLNFEKIVLISEATDLRAGMDGLQTKAIQLAGAVGPHQAYVFLNRNQHLLKLVMHDAMGTWLCTRRLHEGRFHGAGVQHNPELSLVQLHALTQGLPWHRLGEASIFRYA